MGSILRIQDDVESVDFIADSNGIYKLLDATLDAPPPDAVDVRSSRNSNRLIERTWRNRQVSFEFKVNEVPSVEDIFESITRVSRIIGRATNQTYLDGDSFSGTPDIDTLFTGDAGCVLQIRFGPVGTTTLDDEDGGTYTDSRILTTKIISGTMEVIAPMSITTQLDESSGEREAMRVRVNLECDPFFLGDPQIILEVDDPGYCQPPDNEGEYTVNKVLIPAGDIPGDVPALTRITTRVFNSLGIIMARHAGNCIINTPSYPVFSGSGAENMIVGGYSTDSAQFANELIMRVKVVATDAGGDSVQYSLNDGSSWSGSIVLEDHATVDIGATGFYFTFFVKTGHTVDDYWRFRGNQSYLLPNVGSTIQVGLGGAGDDAGYMSKDGTIVDSFYVNFPAEATGKYKVLCQMEWNQALDPEFRMQLAYRGFVSGTWWEDTKDAGFDWVRGFEGYLRNIVDLGTIDLTPSGAPSRGHPGSHSMATATLYVRGAENEAVDYQIGLTKVFLCPVQDDDGFLWAGWKFDGTGREVYSNFDVRNPYIAEISASMSDKDATNTIYDDATDVTLENVRVVSLDESHVGNMLTLMPGVDNTIVFAPLVTGLLGNPDFRGSYWNTASVGITNAVTIAIRPRYLIVGGAI